MGRDRSAGSKRLVGKYTVEASLNCATKRRVKPIVRFYFSEITLGTQNCQVSINL